MLQLEGTSILRQLNIHFLACLESYCDFLDMFKRPWEVEKKQKMVFVDTPFSTCIPSGFSAWQKAT